MPLSTGGKAGRRKRRKRLEHAGETLEDTILRESEENVEFEPQKQTKKRRRKWSEIYAIFTALVIAPAYILLWVLTSSGESMGKGAPVFFLFVLNFPLCIAWVILDRKDDPGADEPLSPKVRQAMRKGEPVSTQDKLGSPNMWRH